MYPMLWGMYGRGEKRKGKAAERFTFRTIRQVQDICRSLDYLETRPDIDRAKLAYLGFSAGSFLAPMVLAMEPRFKVSELVVAGFIDTVALPEADGFNFVPRIRTPLLMLNGRYDIGTPLDTSQRPFLNALGTPKADKKLVLLEAGHALVGFPAGTRESLQWLDRYLGPVAARP